MSSQSNNNISQFIRQESRCECQLSLIDFEWRFAGKLIVYIKYSLIISLNFT